MEALSTSIASLQQATSNAQGQLARWVDGLQQRVPGAPRSGPSCSGRTASRFSRAAPRFVVPPRDVRFAAIIPGDTIAEQVITSGFLNFLNLYNSALVLRLVLTWFPSVPDYIMSPVATVCDPYLNLFRGIIPPLGGTLDLSPILAFVTLNFFTGAAAALPCEMGPDGSPPPFEARMAAAGQGRPEGWQQWLQPSRYEQLWARRMRGQRARAVGLLPAGQPGDGPVGSS